jgi:phage terminase large subunit-like protein
VSNLPDVVAWAQSDAGFYIPETKQPIQLAQHQADILRHILTPGEDGRLPYAEVVYSCPKKSGKSTIAALVLEFFALFIESPNEIYSCANDLEQAQSRAFKALCQSVRLNRHLGKRADPQVRAVHFDNGTSVWALASDYAGAAGSNHGLSTFDELWAYMSERSRRLWDEMTPPPTRKIAMRFTTTYAGYSGESELLEGLHDKGKAGEVIPELEHVENGEGQPACRRSGKLFVYWDHELKPHPGLTMTPAEYHEEQRANLRPLAYLRLHENRFTTNETSFVTPEQWELCYSPELRALADGDERILVLGADASTHRDCTALVGVTYNQDLKTVDVVYCKVWRPAARLVGKPTIDLDLTIKSEIQRLNTKFRVGGVLYDPYQLHSIAMNLRDAGVHMVEMPQTAQRVEADQALYDAIIGRTLRHFGHPDLTEHMINAVAIESPRGFRLAKEKASRKIDAAVALSMAHKHAFDYGVPLDIF